MKFFDRLKVALGTTKRSKGVQVGKTHNMKDLNKARLVKAKALKGLKAWRKWETGHPLQNGKDIKKKVNNCFNYLNKKIVEEEWEVQELNNWFKCSEQEVAIWAKKVVSLAMRWKRNLVRTTQRKIIEERVNTLYEKYKYCPKEFYRRVMGFTNGGKMEVMKDPNTGEMHTDEDKISEIMYNTWEKMYVTKKAQPKHTPEWLKKAPEGIHAYKSKEPTVKDVKRIIKGMKSGTAPGTSRLPPEVLKHLSDADMIVISKLLKYCWIHKNIPEAWRICAIVLLEKDPSSNFLPENYRPISLLNTLYKVYTTFLHEQLKEHMVSNNLMAKIQYGYAKGKSTIEPIMTVINVLEDARYKAKSVWISLIDLKKAYDSVEHWLIKQALEFYQVDKELIEAVMSCYVGEKAFLKLPFGNTKLFDITRGVRQGDVLSPLLFLYGG